MADFTDELEPLFDYSRVQPVNVVCLDDDESPVVSKKRKVFDSKVENVGKQVINCEDNEEEDWLPPPPKVAKDAKISENSTLKELRAKKQELLSFAESAKTTLRDVEESVKRELGNSVLSNLEGVADQPSKPASERAKIVVSVQDKEGLKQFRIYMDDKFERLFKLYADKVKLDPKSIVFCFDGEKVGTEATPASLEMEDNDIIEVRIKSG
ncbi:hypothetical protein UlMin_040455 [Ulmus minor]